MATINKCDRCGAIYEHNSLKIDYDGGFYVLTPAKVKIVDEYYDVKANSYDLCDKCFEELLEFLKPQNK